MPAQWTGGQADEETARKVGEIICPMIWYARIQYFNAAEEELFSNYVGRVASGDTITIKVPTPDDFHAEE